MEIIQKLRKRDGRIVDFDLNRIILAASKALKAAGTGNEKIAGKILKALEAELGIVLRA